MATHQSYSPEFKRALQLFLKSPQSKLIRYICASIQADADYALRNRRRIVRVVKDVLRVQGIDPDIALDGIEVSRMIMEAAIRLKIKTRDDLWELF